MIISIVIFVLGYLPPSFETLTSSYEIIWSFFMVLYLIIVPFSSLFSICYFIMKKANYSYQLCLLRSYFSLFFYMMVLFSSLFLQRSNLGFGILFIVICPLIAFIVMLLSLHKKQPLNMAKYALLTVIIILGVSVKGFIEIWNETYLSPDLSIVSSSDLKLEDHSLVLDYYHYKIEEFKEVDYVRSLYDHMDTYILNKYLDRYGISFEKSRIEGYDIYRADYMIVIYKDGQILKANSDMIQLDSLLKELDW